MAATALLLASGPVALAEESPASAIEEPRFSRHVVAVLSRLGCNAGGGCHGAPKGQNGFRLSLWGGHPDQDYVALTKEAGGRRINRLNVETSLLLKKPTTSIAHKGGKKLEPGSPEYEVLRRWLEQGAKLDDLKASKGGEIRTHAARKVREPG